MPAIVFSAGSFAILDANRAAIDLYGYEYGQLKAFTFLELFQPDAKIHPARLNAELEKVAHILGPAPQRHADGRKLVVRMVLLPYAGDVEARIALIQDETREHTEQEQLEASEERYRDLFENANDMIFLHDLKGKILAINRVAEQLTGYSRDEVLGESFERLIAPEWRDQMQDTVSAHLGGSTTQHYELAILSRFGVRRFLEVNTRVLYRRGQPLAIQGIGRDITERKQGQQRLLESSRALQQKNEELSTALRLAREATQLKEQFLANTSHELRTPMNGIMGMINLLKGTDLTGEQREYADAVSQCANDLLTIINDILDLSQIEAGRLPLVDEPYDIQESVKTVIRLVGIRARAKGLVLTSEIAPGMPTRIRGDCVRVRQVLTNLVANAVKFTPAGGVHVRISAPHGGTRMWCEVIDSGIGVEEAARERIFEAFVQADGTTRRRFGGTGLGLAICKQLVETMGGRIGVVSNEGRPGSTFWFELPLRAAEEAQEEELASACQQEG